MRRRARASPVTLGARPTQAAALRCNRYEPMTRQRLNGLGGSASQPSARSWSSRSSAWSWLVHTCTSRALRTSRSGSRQHEQRSLRTAATPIPSTSRAASNAGDASDAGMAAHAMTILRSPGLRGGAGSGWRLQRSGHLGPDPVRRSDGSHARLGSGLASADPRDSVGWGVAAGAWMLGMSVPVRIAPAAKMAAVTPNAVV